jgi:hypothetical protein
MLRIHIYNDPAALGELRQALADADCSVSQVGEDTLLVTHPLAVDEAEARFELAFFLKAWQATRPDAEVELLA